MLVRRVGVRDLECEGCIAVLGVANWDMGIGRGVPGDTERWRVS